MFVLELVCKTRCILGMAIGVIFALSYVLPPLDIGLIIERISNGLAPISSSASHRISSLRPVP